MEKEILIYGLRDPLTDEYRYIGKSTSGLKRPKAHFTYSHNESVNIWMYELRQCAVLPYIDVLEYCNEEELNSKEKFWVNFYLDSGCKLFNTIKYLGHNNEVLETKLLVEQQRLNDLINSVTNEISTASSIGGYITKRRKQLNLTQPQLSDICGIGINTLYKLERGQSNPTIGILLKLYDYLGCTLVPMISRPKLM